MKYIKLFVVIIGITISACSEADNVPIINDLNNIIVDGKKMTKTEYFQKYCASKPEKQGNNTCEKVRISMLSDSFHGQMPKGW